MLRYNAGNLTNSFSVFRVPQNVITYPKTELSHRRKPPPATPSKKDIAAISCPSMQIYNYSDNTARRRSRDSGALNHFSPPTPAKARPRSGQGPTTPPRPPKDQQIMQSIKVGRLLCSVAAIPEWKQHPRCTSARTTSPVPDKLFSTASRAIGPGIDTLGIDELLLELKQVVVTLVVMGMRRSEALSASRPRVSASNPRAGAANRLPIQTTLPPRCSGQTELRSGRMRRGGLLNRRRKGHSPQRHSRCRHQTGDPGRRYTRDAVSPRGRHRGGGERSGE